MLKAQLICLKTSSMRKTSPNDGSSFLVRKKERKNRKKIYFFSGNCENIDFVRWGPFAAAIADVIGVLDVAKEMKKIVLLLTDRNLKLQFSFLGENRSCLKTITKPCLGICHNLCFFIRFQGQLPQTRKIL
jgi:hypothetical protein